MKRLLDMVAHIDSILRQQEFHFHNEQELQNGIAVTLTEAMVQFEREALIGAATESRVDFLIGRIALEVKVGGGVAPVMRQLDRYAHCEGIDAIILVTSRLRHLVCLPSCINSKPLHVTEIVRL